MPTRRATRRPASRLPPPAARTDMSSDTDEDGLPPLPPLLLEY